MIRRACLGDGDEQVVVEGLRHAQLSGREARIDAAAVACRICIVWVQATDAVRRSLVASYDVGSPEHRRGRRLSVLGSIECAQGSVEDVDLVSRAPPDGGDVLFRSDEGLALGRALLGSINVRAGDACRFLNAGNFCRTGSERSNERYSENISCFHTIRTIHLHQ